eukprot:6209128-Prymnesium_polylepis.1
MLLCISAGKVGGNGLRSGPPNETVPRQKRKPLLFYSNHLIEQQSRNHFAFIRSAAAAPQPVQFARWSVADGRCCRQRRYQATTRAP